MERIFWEWVFFWFVVTAFLAFILSRWKIVKENLLELWNLPDAIAKMFDKKE